LDRRLSGPQSWSGRGDEDKNSRPLPGLEPPIIQPVAQRYTAELSRLLHTLYRVELKMIANCALKGIWEEAVVVYLSHYMNLGVKLLRIYTKDSVAMDLRAKI
jgi:hypothetical protein